MLRGKRVKVIKFPKENMTKPRWLLKLKNMDKMQVLNRVFAFLMLLAGIAVAGFIVYKMNQ